ncbi:GTPase IMAP family member 8 [Labeo rohita]|uniref:GTPase IMAP family member 8 n=1 Tax=Labeo rohita TaxID=84645 RepID=UPI0021E25555|nr:GTPase IMAP family member 8 [Labeo rohita]
MDFSNQVSAERGAGSRGSLSELCLVLVGSIGCGKTMTADTLLGQTSAPGPSASSRVSQIRRGLSEGRRLSVVETPRWYWRGKEVEVDIQEETRRFLSSSVSGPFVFLILVPIGEFTEMEGRIPDQLERMFGPSVLGHTLVLLTCGEYLMGRSLDEYLRKEVGLQEVVRRCHGRCHVISNRKPEDKQQVVALLEKVEQMIQRNGGFQLLRDEETHRRDVREEQKTEMKLSATRDTMWNGGIGGKQTQINTFDKRTEETGSDETIETRLINGLQSRQHEGEETHGRHAPPEKSLSFKLNKEGALLSQMMEVPEVQYNQSFINTIHHSIKKVSDDSKPVSPLSSHSSSSSSNLLDDSSLPELRLVLLGRRGSGKSAAGNVILGCEMFDVHRDDVSAASQRCVKAKALLDDTRVSVVDTPDWFQSERSPEEVKGQISSCLALLAPGPHAFLLCIPVDRPARSELPALSALEGAFGPDAVRRHTIVLFTRSDLLPEGAGGVEQVEAYIASRRPEMLELVQKCGDRYHVLRRGNTDGRQSGGVKELLEKVQQTVKESGGDFYSCSPFRQNQEEIATVRRDRQRDRDRQNPSHSLDALKEEEEEVTSTVKGDRLDSAAPAPSPLRSAWETTSSCAGRVPKLLAVGALAGAALGVFLAGAVGGAVGAVLGSAVTEVGRRRYNKQKTE